MQRLSLLVALVLLAPACSKKNDEATVDPDSTATSMRPTHDPDDPPPVDEEPEPRKDQRTRQSGACDTGKADVCTSVGVMWEQGKEGPADPVKAREYYERGCVGGHQVGCSYLAQMLDKGVGGPADPKAARELWLTQCERGNMAECFNAAVSLDRKSVG